MTFAVLFLSWFVLSTLSLSITSWNFDADAFHQIAFPSKSHTGMWISVTTGANLFFRYDFHIQIDAHRNARCNQMSNSHTCTHRNNIMFVVIRNKFLLFFLFHPTFVYSNVTWPCHHYEAKCTVPETQLHKKSQPDHNALNISDSRHASEQACVCLFVFQSRFVSGSADSGLQLQPYPITTA